MIMAHAIALYQLPPSLMGHVTSVTAAVPWNGQQPGPSHAPALSNDNPLASPSLPTDNVENGLAMSVNCGMD